MINVVKDIECTYVRLSHDFITQHNDTYELKLEITNQANGGVTEVVIEQADIVTPAEGDMYYEYAITNGVYSLRLMKTVGTTVSYIQACVFMDCDIRCKAVSTDIETSMLHYALTLAEECDCDCDKMGNIYELLLQKVEENPCKSC